MVETQQAQTLIAQRLISIRGEYRLRGRSILPGDDVAVIAFLLPLLTQGQRTLSL